MTPWISTKERLPEDGDAVIAVYPIGKGAAARLSWVAGEVRVDGRELYIDSETDGFSFDGMEYWMSIPINSVGIINGVIFIRDETK